MSEKLHWFDRFLDPSPQPASTKDGRKIYFTSRGDRYIDREELIHSDHMQNVIKKVRDNKNLIAAVRRLSELPSKDSAQ